MDPKPSYRTTNKTTGHEGKTSDNLHYYNKISASMKPLRVPAD